MINSTLEWIHVQGISLISLSAIIFEAVPFSPSLPEAGTRKRKKRIEMGYKDLGMRGAGILLLGK
jgi:hypothetical protein